MLVRMTTNFQPAPRRMSATKIVLISLAATFAVLFAVLAGCAALLGGAVAGVEQQATDRARDVKIVSCQNTGGGLVEVHYEIVNSGATEQTYFPHFDLVDESGVRLGEAVGFDSDVPAAATVEGVATGTISSKRKFSCKLRSA